jgi:hypothetical protein
VVRSRCLSLIGGFCVDVGFLLAVVGFFFAVVVFFFADVDVFLAVVVFCRPADGLAEAVDFFGAVVFAFAMIFSCLLWALR